jgi:hypothetical protein
MARVYYVRKRMTNSIRNVRFLENRSRILYARCSEVYDTKTQGKRDVPNAT